MAAAISIIIGGLLVGSAYALLAVGFTLIYNVSGIMNFTQGAFAAMGALLMYTLLSRLGLNLFVALIASLVAMAILGAAVEFIVIRPALGKQSHLNIILLTVALLIMLQGATFILWGSDPYSLPSFSGERPLHIWGIFFPTQSLWILGTLAVVVGAVWWLLNRTVFGKALRACAENADAASLVGIPVSRMVLFTFTASGAVGALGGIMISPITALDFNSSSGFTNNGFIAAVLGGMGSFFGGVLGGLTLGIAEQLAAGFVSSLFSSTIALVALLAMLIWRPGGILGQMRGTRVDVQESGARSGYSLPARFYQRAWRYSLLIVAFILVLPLFMRAPAVLNSLVITGLFFIAVLGVDLLMGIAGQISLGQAGFMAIGGYTSGILAVRFGVQPIIGLLVGLALSLGVAAVLGIISIRVRGVYLAVATLAFGVLVQSLAVGMIGVTGGPSGLTGIPLFAVGPMEFSGVLPNYYLVWLLVGAVLYLLTNLTRSARGRALRAIKSDETAGEALGVSVIALKIQVFLLSAGLASLAGSLYGFYFRFLSPDMVGSQVSFDLITMLVLGGEGTLIGPIFGVLLLTFLPTVFQPLANYKPLVEGLLLLVIILRFPGGILGGLLDGRARLAQLFKRRVRADLTGVEI